MTDVLGGPDNQDRVPVEADLGAEPAADVGGDDPDGTGVEPEHTGQDEPGDLRVLGAHPGGQLAVFPGGGGGPALQRDRGEPLVLDGPLDDDLAAVKGAVVGGSAAADRDVGLGRGEQQRAAFQGGVVADHHGQRVVVDADQFGGVLALVAVVGDDHRDRLADVPDPVHGEQRLGPRAAERQRGRLAAAAAVVGRRRPEVGEVCRS